MKRTRHSYSRGIVGAPTLLLAGAWIALSLLWPQVQGARKPVNVSSPRVAYIDLENEGAIAHRSPILFARSSKVGFSVESSQEQPGDRFAPGPRAIEPEYLDLVDPLLSLRETKGAAEGLPEVASDTYRPLWANETSTGPDSGRMLKLLVEPSAVLKECGFHVPDTLIGKVIELNRPFILTADVDLAVDGRVADVFLVESSGDRSVDRVALGLLGQGSARRNERRLSGRVVVSMGQEAVPAAPSAVTGITEDGDQKR